MHHVVVEGASVAAGCFARSASGTSNEGAIRRDMDVVVCCRSSILMTKGWQVYCRWKHIGSSARIAFEGASRWR